MQVGGRSEKNLAAPEIWLERRMESTNDVEKMREAKQDKSIFRINFSGSEMMETNWNL